MYTEPQLLMISKRREKAFQRISELNNLDLEGMLTRITADALCGVNAPRFWRAERGFHGEFHALLREKLRDCGIVRGDCPILEQEYQKSSRHATGQRPDSILHIPSEEYCLNTDEGNFAVWALKHKASEEEALQDFYKLDVMFCVLKYRFGFSLNVGSNRTHSQLYSGKYANRLFCIACDRNENGDVEFEIETARE